MLAAGAYATGAAYDEAFRGIYQGPPAVALEVRVDVRAEAIGMQYPVLQQSEAGGGYAT
jgi:hypothetical protein